MSDFLSQEQIDSLLSSQASDGFNVNDVGEDSSVSEAASGPDYQALTEAFQLFIEQAQSVIATVLSKDVSFTITQCEAMDANALKNAVPSPLLSIQLALSGAVTGECHLLMATKEVAALSDLMMMGDGKAEYNDDHKDAIGELFNQIMGSFTTALGQKCGDSVSAGPIAVLEFDFTVPSFSLEHCDMVIVTMTIPDIGDASIALVVPGDLGAELMKHFKTSAGFGSEGGHGNVGLSASEVDDLSELSTDMDDGDTGGFHTSSLSDSTVNAPKENVNMLLDVELDVSIELGKADLSIKRILELAPGSIIELDRMAGEPVDLMVNKKVVAKGEVVVVDESFGIRIVSLVSPEERIRSLR
jgi:flagellar motor switch protein FliN/FliY